MVLVNVNRLGLLESLFQKINTKDTSSVDYVIANYLLSNYKDISELNIYDVAAECNVSRSTVRRFFSKIGFENFQSFKTEFTSYDDQKNRYNKFYQETETFEGFEGVVLDTIREPINKDVFDDISSYIKSSKKVVFVCSGIGSSSISYFQQGMLFLGKVIQVISQQYINNSLIEQLKKEDLLIVLSGTGVIAAEIQSHIAALNCTKLLITFDTNEPQVVENEYKIYSLETSIKVAESNIIYQKYKYLIFFDKLLLYYAKKHFEGDIDG